MGAQKTSKERACLAFELISYWVSLFSFVGGNKEIFMLGDHPTKCFYQS